MFDVHVAIDVGDTVRIGGTDSLNLDVAHDQVYTFHPNESPFHATSVLTTYSRVTATCHPTVEYDDKLPPIMTSKGTFHTGVATITMDPSCGPNDCISFEFEDEDRNVAGKCRIVYDATCAHLQLMV